MSFHKTHNHLLENKNPQQSLLSNEVFLGKAKEADLLFRVTDLLHLLELSMGKK